MAKTRAVTVKLPEDLYEQASDFVALTGLSFRELFSQALERELSKRVRAGGDRLRETLETMRDYRQGHTPAA